MPNGLKNVENRCVGGVQPWESCIGPSDAAGNPLQKTIADFTPAKDVFVRPEKKADLGMLERGGNVARKAEFGSPPSGLAKLFG